ncbi:Beta-galactosidase GanA [Paenibacillus sp. 1_12]|uniref:beta-galactosidase n=1 Tax=Paenibacillus sp. 1_12 TaxID=1566278 RepID=UPI0008E4618F|nr:beta-galactosidase [Paenibacillus sp. 1_12]SFK83489.1 Beta-galactosidase GanA [Paenibacillus sp. 1_12]
MKSFPYGSVLKVQREFTLETIKKKLDSMSECGMNFVVIWPAVFWWENKANANYPFQTGIEILKHAEQIGMKVIMELAGQITALEYAPDFLMREEYYATKANGTVDNDKIIFDYLNYNHPEVKQLVKKNYTDVANAYKGYAALYGYDILNETMFTSYDRYTLQLFRSWLEDKYGTIDRLNEVWDRSYYDWQQIEFTYWLWASVMPFVDWEQFRKANVGMILNEWKGYVKAVDPDHPTIADNINSMIATDNFYTRPHDDWNVAENVDEYGISFYPKENLVGQPHYKRWETFVGVHSATKTGRFWISELQSHHRNMFNPNSIVYPYELKWWNWEAISHGAKGMIYWKWDPFIKGIQTAGRGLVDTQGGFTPRAHAAAEIANILETHAREFTSYEPEQPRVAILYDKLTHDFTKAFTLTVPKETNIYINSIAGLYECLWELNIPAKFITPDDVKSGKVNEFQTLFLTNQLAIGPELADAIKQFAEQGGTVIADGKFGEIREDSILNEDLPGGELNTELGYRFVDIDPLNLQITLEADGDKAQTSIPGYFERKILSMGQSQAEVWGSFSDHNPAVLCSPIGQGRIIYISTMLWYGYHMEPNPDVLKWVQQLDAKYSLALHSAIDSRLKLCTLRGEDGLLLFVFNYTDEAVQSEVVLNGIGSKLESAADITHGSDTVVSQQQDQVVLQVAIPSKDVAIYKLSWRG